MIYDVLLASARAIGDSLTPLLTLFVFFANRFLLKTDTVYYYTMLEMTHRDDIDIAFVGSSVVTYNFDPAVVTEQTGRVAYDAGLGAIGVPVFSGFRGGFGVLIGPTGGYIAGFLGAALVYWLMTARKNTTARKIAGMAVGMFVCYLFGTLWYVFATGVGLAGFIAATAKCVLPFIVPDAMKCVLAFWLAKKIRIKK